MKRNAFLNRERISAEARLVPPSGSAIRPRLRCQSLGGRVPGPRKSDVAIAWRRLGLFEKLRPHHMDIQRRINTDPDLIAIDAHHLDGDVVAN